MPAAPLRHCQMPLHPANCRERAEAVGMLQLDSPPLIGSHTCAAPAMPPAHSPRQWLGGAPPMYAPGGPGYPPPGIMGAGGKPPPPPPPPPPPCRCLFQDAMRSRRSWLVSRFAGGPPRSRSLPRPPGLRLRLRREPRLSPRLHQSTNSWGGISQPNFRTLIGRVQNVFTPVWDIAALQQM